MGSNSYFGKYRAKVVDISDPQERGRVRVQCPKVLGDAKSAWCEVCVPVAGDGDGDFCLPKVGETVWVEFEEGNANKPVVSGGWYSENMTPLPETYSEAKNMRVISFNGTRITMTRSKMTGDASGSVSLRGGSGSFYLSTSSSSVSCSGSGVVFSGNGFTLSADTVYPPGEPPPDPVSKTKITAGDDTIQMSVNEEESYIKVNLDEISIDYKDTVKIILKEDSLSISYKDDIKIEMADPSLDISFKTSKFSVKETGIEMEVQGSKCEFNQTSLATLKGLIGG